MAMVSISTPSTRPAPNSSEARPEVVASHPVRRGSIIHGHLMSSTDKYQRPDTIEEPVELQRQSVTLAVYN